MPASTTQEAPAPAANGPTRQARGERRRTELLDAALQLIARAGVAAVTHRAVAAEAGVTHRLTTYYFKTKEQMVIEAFRHLAARSVARTRQAAAAVAHAIEGGTGHSGWLHAVEVAVDSVVDAVLDAEDGDPREDASAELSMVLALAQHEELAADYAAWQDQVEAILVEHARALNATDPTEEARLLHAVMRGLRLELVARPDRPPSRAELHAVVHRLLTSL